MLSNSLEGLLRNTSKYISRNVKHSTCFAPN